MKATALSTNTAFVALAQQLGGCKVRDTMLRLGLHQSDGQPVGKYAPQYILGASDVSPQGVAQAYGVLAADGKKCPMVAVTKVTQGGKELAEPKTTCAQVVDPDVAHATDKFLEYNMTNGSGIRNQLDGGARQSAGKTGTANNNNESWFVGYTPQLATAVWVGTPYDPITRVMKNVTRRWQLLPRHARCRDRRPDLEGHHERRPPGPADRARSRSPRPSSLRAPGRLQVSSRSVDGAVRRRGDLDPPGRRLSRRRGRHHGLVGAQRPRRRHLALRERAQRHAS